MRIRLRAAHHAGLPEACSVLDVTTIASLDDDERNLLRTLAKGYAQACLAFAKRADKAPSLLDPHNRTTYFKRALAKTKAPRS